MTRRRPVRLPSGQSQRTTHRRWLHATRNSELRLHQLIQNTQAGMLIWGAGRSAPGHLAWSSSPGRATCGESEPHSAPTASRSSAAATGGAGGAAIATAFVGERQQYHDGRRRKAVKCGERQYRDNVRQRMVRQRKQVTRTVETQRKAEKQKLRPDVIRGYCGYSLFSGI